MIILVGPSASGKTEVAKLLERDYKISKIITTTTRKKRKNEIDGKDYYFISKESFENLIKEKAFVEYTIYNGNYYGSRKDQISDDKCVVVDPNGLDAYNKLNISSICSFALLAKEQTRYERMIKRGDKLEDALERIKKDKKEFSLDKLYEADYIIDTEKHSIAEVCKIVFELYKEYLENIK